MNCAVGSSEKTRNRPYLTDSGRAIHGHVAALLAGALLATAAVSPAQAQNTAPAATAPASPSSSTTAPAAKKPAAAKSATTGTAATGAAGASDKNASYAIGVSVGSELHRSGVAATDISAERIAAGVRDALGGKVAMSAEYQQTIMGLLRKAHDAELANRAKEAEPNHAAAAAFLAENGKKPGVITTASGLEYKVNAAGAGAPPKPGENVTVNYRGTLLNGTEFDASSKHGGPATFASNQVIPGWQEALALMKPGAKYQLWIPPKLAYDLQSPPTIPPGSMLLFDVELISVKPAAAAAPPGAGAMHPQIQPAQPPK